MARFTQPFDFYQTALETKPVFSEEDDMSVLDDKILDPASDVSMADPRRSSYDHNGDAMQPAWGDFAPPPPPQQPQTQQQQQQSRPRQDSGMYDSSMMLDTAQANAAYAQQSWPMSRDSGSCTPTPVYDQFGQEFSDANSAGAFSGGAVGPISMNYAGMNYRGNMFGGAPGGVAMSPQSSQGWMPSTGDMGSTRSPTLRTDSNLHLRRDGIRKKNARFEIPAERTLNNIDQLIAQSSNEDEIKELKQQKRLLRNRQAAYVLSLSLSLGLYANRTDLTPASERSCTPRSSKKKRSSIPTSSVTWRIWFAP